MKTNTRFARNEHSIITRLIDFLLDILMIGKNNEEKIKKLMVRLDQLDNNNPQFADLREDHQEKNKMFLFLLVGSLSFIIDYILISNPIAILCKGFHLPDLLKFIIPFVLVIVEVGVGYSSILRQHSGELDKWIGRNLQYFVIGILVALSIFLLLYLIQNYNPAIDGPFIPFLLSNMVIQIILLIPSVMLHLWIIRHAQDISEAMAFYKYLYARGKIEREIEKLEKEQKQKQGPQFVKGARIFVQKKESYEAIYGDGGFDKIIPKDLAIAINKIMGRQVFCFDIKVEDELA